MKKLIVANWKMNPKTSDEARKLFLGIEHRMHFFNDKAQVVLCPPFIYLPQLSLYSHHIRLGAQNLHAKDSGAFTGEVSVAQLSGLRVTHVILGHSERRIYFGETDSQVREKIEAALRHKMIPVVCLGGDPKASKGTMKRLVTKQFKAAVNGLDKKLVGKIIFVYEPIWAISTFKNAEPATGEHAAELTLHIRDLLEKIVGTVHAANMPILYGGSVNKANVHEFSKFPTIDGALVGAASLDSDNFMTVVKEFHRESIHKT